MNFNSLWAKFVAIFNGVVEVAEVEFSADEKAILALMQPLLASAEAATVQDLITFIKGVLSQAKTAKDLPTFESDVLNALQATGSELLALAKSLGSNLLQALIAFVLASLPTTHPANIKS